MAEITRAPTSDEASGGTVTGSAGTRYQVVDDYPDTAPTDYLEYGTTANSFTTFAYDAISLSGGSFTVYVDYYDAEPATGANTVAGRLKVGGTYYNAATHNPSGTTYTQRTDTWAVNPKTTTSWTQDDINNIGADALQAFGVIGPDSNPKWRCSSVQLRIAYTPYAYGDAVLPSTAAQTTVGYVIASGAAQLDATATQDTVGVVSVMGAAALDATATQVTDGSIGGTQWGAASLTADATHAVAGYLTVQGLAQCTTGCTQETVGFITLIGSSSLAGTGTQTATGFLQLMCAVTLNAEATEQVDGSIQGSVYGAANLLAVTTQDSIGYVHVYGSAICPAEATTEALGYCAVYADGSYVCTGDCAGVGFVERFDICAVQADALCTATAQMVYSANAILATECVCTASGYVGSLAYVYGAADIKGAHAACWLGYLYGLLTLEIAPYHNHLEL